MGLAVAVVIYAIAAAPADRPSPVFAYEGIEYTDLLLRPMGASIARVINPPAGENCFTVADENMHVFPAGMKDAMAEADANTQYDFLEYERVENPEYSSASLYATNEEVLHVLENYDNFDTRIETVDHNYLNIPDSTYNFECFFQYGDNQYMMRMYFGSYYPMDVRFSTIAFERNEQGEPFIENPDIMVSSGDVNGTVLFVNNLGEDAVLRYENSNFADEEVQTLEKTIPAGRMLSVNTGRYLASDDGAHTYFYSVVSHGLEGTITKKPHPACITDVQEAKSYYAPSSMLKFPSYLPESYSLLCGVHVSSYDFIATFADAELAAEYNGTRPPLSDKFLAAGGLRIMYTDHLAFSFWDRDLMLYEQSAAAKSSAEQYGSSVEPLGESLLVAGQRTITIDGKEYTMNTVHVYGNTDSYNIESAILSYEELLKVARSLES